MCNKLDNELSVQDIVADMRIGWNLGNSLEAPAPEKEGASLDEYETSWLNPLTTKDMILSVIKAGFNTIRIPVSWGKLMSKGAGYKINVAWLDRVQEVVDYAYNEDVYVIIDVHHEDDWLFLGNKEMEERAKEILGKLWLQIAERFKNYNEHLLFETMNETRLIGTEDEWTQGTAEARKVINVFNKVAVRAIRSTGGNNLHRLVVIKTIGARYNVEAIRDVEIPNNDKRVLLSVHTYIPYLFSMVAEQDIYWGTEDDKKELVKIIDGIASTAQEKGLSVIIGEFGCIDKHNEDVRAAYTAFFVGEARKRGITCIVWDNNIAYERDKNLSYSIFDREKLVWRFPKILKALIDNA